MSEANLVQCLRTKSWQAPLQQWIDHTSGNISQQPVPMSSFRSAMVLLCMMLPSFPIAADAAAATYQPNLYHCANGAARIKAASPIDYREICHGAEDAIAFFARLSLKPTYPLVVEIVPNLPREAGETAVGCFLEDERRILVLEFAEFRKSRTWFNVPINRSMYRSLVTHEVAHAVAACNMAIPEPTIQAKEYLAYVAMFATMGRSLREEIMKANPGKAFDRESKINTTIYLCDPMRFAVKAYRHFLKDEHGDAFLHKVLSGQALAF